MCVYWHKNKHMNRIWLHLEIDSGAYKYGYLYFFWKQYLANLKLSLNSQCKHSWPGTHNPCISVSAELDL